MGLQKLTTPNVHDVGSLQQFLRGYEMQYFLLNSLHTLFLRAQRRPRGLEDAAKGTEGKGGKAQEQNTQPDPDEKSDPEPRG